MTCNKNLTFDEHIEVTTKVNKLIGISPKLKSVLSTGLHP